MVNERRQNRLMAIQALSSLVIAASVVTLVRYRRGENIPTPSHLPQDETSESSPGRADSASDRHHLPLRTRIVRDAVNIAVALGVAAATLLFGSLNSPTGIATTAAGVALLFAWSVWFHWHTLGQLVLTLLNSTMVAALVGLVVLGIASAEDLLMRIVFLFVAMILFGLMIWDSERNVAGSRSELGAALMGGAVVAAAVFFGQFTIDDRARIQDFQSNVAFSQDLTGVDLRNRDLSSLHLYGKIFKGGNLALVNLSESYLVKANLTDAFMYQANLTEADLSEAVLEGITLSEATLTNADLSDVTKTSGANLTKAVLEYANLTGANFENTVLDEAKLVGISQDREEDETVDGPNLSGATLTWADLTEADLRSADLSYADLTGAILRATDLSGADLSQATIDGAILEPKSLRGANLRGVHLDTTDLSTIPLERAIFDRETKWPKGFVPSSASVYLLERGAQLRNSNLAEKELGSVDLRDSDLRKARLMGANLSDSNLRRADLRNAFMEGANLRSADLSGADLRGARLYGADLRKAKLSNTQLDGASAASDTMWPRGFDPKSAGVHVIEEGE